MGSEVVGCGIECRMGMGEERRTMGEHSVLERVEEREYWLVKILLVNLWVVEVGNKGVKELGLRSGRCLGVLLGFLHNYSPAIHFPPVL